jgi:type I restriction enzyme S subunit
MNQLPKNWVTAPIGSLCDLKNGRAFKPGEWSQDGLPIVRIQNLNKPSAPFNRFNGTYDNKHYLKGGELLFAWSGTPGTSFGAHVWQSGEALLNQHIFRVDFDDALLDRRFFRHAINQKLTELIGVAHGGAGLQHVTKGVFEATEVALPPRSEQNRIADKLDTVLTRVDAVNTRLARVAPLLKRFRQSVLTAATSGRLTEDWRLSADVAQEWQVTDVQSVAHVGTGSTPLRSNTEFFASTGTPWITSAATSQEVVNVAAEYVTQAAITAHRLKVYPVGTLLVAMYGEGKTRGQVTELGITATINQACAAVVVDESKMLKAFVKLALQANYFEMRVLAEGGNQPNLNLAKVKGFPLPFPCLKEQAEIVRRVETLFAFADRLEARLQTAQTAADRLTPSLLAKAFRGELVPQDPNDEPASELLKRLAMNTPLTAKRSRKPRESSVNHV